MLSRTRYATIAVRKLSRTVLLGFAIVLGTEGSPLAQSAPQAIYRYDAAGNTLTVVYTDQTCVVHTYDSSGNRAATDITKASVPENPVYGDGVWGCFEWTP